MEISRLVGLALCAIILIAFCLLIEVWSESVWLRFLSGAVAIGAVMLVALFLF